MSDMQRSSIQEAVGRGVKRSALLKELHEQRRILRKAVQLQSEQRPIDDEDPAVFEAYINEIFHVLALLGQSLLSLDIFDDTEYSSTLVEVRASIANAGHAQLTAQFGELQPEDEYLCSAALTVCAAFAPLHLYRGFGACIQGDWDFACPDFEYLDKKAKKGRIALLAPDPQPNRPILLALDRALQILQMRPLRFLQDRPAFSALADAQPRYNPRLPKDMKDDLTVMEEWTKVLEKRGHPMPQGDYAVTWGIPFATWTSSFSCEITKDFKTVLANQMDPGRLLHAFLFRGVLDLQAGQILDLIPGSAVESLVCWLEGLPGMTHRVVSWEDLNTRQFEQKASKSVMKRIGRYPIPQKFAVRGLSRSRRPTVAPSPSISPPVSPTISPQVSPVVPLERPPPYTALDYMMGPPLRPPSPSPPAPISPATPASYSSHQFDPPSPILEHRPFSRPQSVVSFSTETELAARTPTPTSTIGSTTPPQSPMRTRATPVTEEPPSLREPPQSQPPPAPPPPPPQPQIFELGEPDPVELASTEIPHMPASLVNRDAQARMAEIIRSGSLTPSAVALPEQPMTAPRTTSAPPSSQPLGADVNARAGKRKPPAAPKFYATLLPSKPPGIPTLNTTPKPPETKSTSPPPPAAAAAAASSSSHLPPRPPPKVPLKPNRLSSTSFLRQSISSPHSLTASPASLSPQTPTDLYLNLLNAVARGEITTQALQSILTGAGIPPSAATQHSPNHVPPPPPPLPPPLPLPSTPAHPRSLLPQTRRSPSTRTSPSSPPPQELDSNPVGPSIMGVSIPNIPVTLPLRDHVSKNNANPATVAAVAAAVDEGAGKGEGDVPAPLRVGRRT